MSKFNDYVNIQTLYCDYQIMNEKFPMKSVNAATVAATYRIVQKKILSLDLQSENLSQNKQ